MPVTRIAFWRNGQGLLYDGAMDFGWNSRLYQDNATGIQTLSGVFGLVVGDRTQRKTGWARSRGVEQALSDMLDMDIEHSEDNGRGRRFTNTADPRFYGTGSWQQHILIFQAIVKSSGWSPVTAALQLFAHLDGEALNVALLMPVKLRERWKHLSNGLSEYDNSPGRLAVVRRRFESANRRPKVDPATFATDPCSPRI